MSNYKEQLEYIIQKSAAVIANENHKLYADLYSQVYDKLDEVVANMGSLGVFEKQMSNLYKTIILMDDKNRSYEVQLADLCKTIISMNDQEDKQGELLKSINGAFEIGLKKSSDLTIEDFVTTSAALKDLFAELLSKASDMDMGEVLLNYATKATNYHYPLSFYQGQRNPLLAAVNKVLNSNFTMEDFKTASKDLRESITKLYLDQADMPKLLIIDADNIIDDNMPLSFYKKQSAAITNDAKSSSLYEALLEQHPKPLAERIHVVITSLANHPLGIEAVKDDQVRAELKSNVMTNVEVYQNAVANFNPIHNETTIVDELIGNFAKNSTDATLKNEVYYTQNKASCFLGIEKFFDDASVRLLNNEANNTTENIEKTLDFYLKDFYETANTCHVSYKMTTVLDDFLYKHFQEKAYSHYNALLEMSAIFAGKDLPAKYSADDFADRLPKVIAKIEAIQDIFALGDKFFQEAEKTREEGVLDKEYMNQLYADYIDKSQEYMTALKHPIALDSSLSVEIGSLGERMTGVYNEFQLGGEKTVAYWEV